MIRKQGIGLNSTFLFCQSVTAGPNLLACVPWLKDLCPYVPHWSPQPSHSSEFSSYEAKPPVSESSLCRHLKITVAANVSVLAATSQVIIIKDTPHLKHTLIMLYMDFEAVMGNSHPPSAIDWLSTFIVLGQIVVSVCCMAHFWLAFTGNGNKKSKNKSGRQSAAMLSWLTHQTKQSLICVSAT